MNIFNEMQTTKISKITEWDNEFFWNPQSRKFSFTVASSSAGEMPNKMQSIGAWTQQQRCRGCTWVLQWSLFDCNLKVVQQTTSSCSNVRNGPHRRDRSMVFTTWRQYRQAPWRRNTVVERRSLTGELSLSCARPVADGWPLMWVNHPLQVSQLGQLSLSSFRGR